MELSTKYDKFYNSSLSKEDLPDLSVNNWPKNRFEAIIHAGGKGDKILDIGCGNGLLLYQYRNLFQKLIGLEYSEHRLEQAKMNLGDLNFHPYKGSAEDMEMIDSNSIDQIITADTIEHIPDVFVAIDEMYRVLKPGGLIVINTPNIAFIKKRMLLFLGRFPSTSQPNEGIGSDILFDGGHFHYFTFRSLKILLERSGFKLVKKMGYGKLGAFHNSWPSITSGGVQWIAEK